MVLLKQPFEWNATVAAQGQQPTDLSNRLTVNCCLDIRIQTKRQKREDTSSKSSFALK